MKPLAACLAVRTVAVAIGCTAAAVGQTWAETCGSSPAGAVALAQALLDVQRDASVLLVASHPDDRYVLPAAWLRHLHGVRVTVLLATRGGGGQNSMGPETGDAFERIRTLETEAGAARLGIDVRYLDRPDTGYRRTAEETFADWGRAETVAGLVRMLRTLRPDAVLTTHHEEESHGHDLALVEALRQAVPAAGDPAFGDVLPPHGVPLFYLGAPNVAAGGVLRLSADRFEPTRGATLRRLAHDVLRQAHRSPGAPGSVESVFDAEFGFVPVTPGAPTDEEAFLAALPDGLAEAAWAHAPDVGARLRDCLQRRLPEALRAGRPIAPLVGEALSALRAASEAGPADHRASWSRRIAALERLWLLAQRIHLEIAAPPGSYAVAGEELDVALTVTRGSPVPLTLSLEPLDDLAATFVDAPGTWTPDGELGRHTLTVSLAVPATAPDLGDPMARRFVGDRFVPPVRVRVVVAADGVLAPVELTVPVELRPPVAVSVVPPMLVLPTGRKSAEFTVRVTRHSRHPVEAALEVRAPAGYVIRDDRRTVSLREQRGAMYRFALEAPSERSAGVDVLRVQMGRSRVTLPVHAIDVATRAGLGVGLLRGSDDTLVGLLGTGGLGIRWSELSDSDLAIADLSVFDTVVVDVRALRDRPEAKRSFPRLLEFASRAGKRLVVFYHKDVEFQPPGEGFVGAPFLPFEVGRDRVTRPDAPVRVLEPANALLNVPNRILPSDWDGWEQERCLYVPRVYAAEYRQLLEMQDPGREPLRGALLHAQTGEGEYVYCSLALWRQLKKLHPGAVRLLANLLTPPTR